MRSIVLLLVGLAVGAIGALIGFNALHKRTPWPNANMAVIGQQMKAMDKSIKANHCAATDLVPRLQTLRFVANDIEPAFAGEIDDPQLGRYAADLRAAADAALAKPPASCAEANAVLSNLGKACDSCHRDFRS